MEGSAFAGLMSAVLERNVPFRFAASGFSMTPFIGDGAVIKLVSLPARLRTGDVVAFLHPSSGKLTVHRIVQVSRAGYLIKGDNVSQPDGWVQRSSMLGLVVRVEQRDLRVQFGFGVERMLIAWLSRRDWLMPVVWSVWRVLKPVAGKWIVKINTRDEPDEYRRNPGFSALG